MKRLLVIVLLAVLLLATAALASPANCGHGRIWKDLDYPWEYHGGENVNRIAVKSDECVWLTASEPEQGCFIAGGWEDVGGFGTGHIQVKVNGEACAEILYVEFYPGFVFYLPMSGK